MPVPDRSTFESLYAGQPRWEIGRPQKALLDVADRITGSVLDAGCGTGENALFFAGRGRTVTGIDFLAEPITRAKKGNPAITVEVRPHLKDLTLARAGRGRGSWFFAGKK